MKKKLLLMILLTWYVAASAQTINVSGKVTDSMGEGLPGASVIIKGTITGTITDVDGNYQLKVSNPANFVLEFKFVGMAPVEIQINGKTTIYEKSL